MIEMGGATPEEAKAAADRLVRVAAEGTVDAKAVPAGPEARSLWRVPGGGARPARPTPHKPPPWPGRGGTPRPPPRRRPGRPHARQPARVAGLGGHRRPARAARHLPA